MRSRIVTIASIVEGHGEVFALPKLLHRLAAEIPTVVLRTAKPPWRRPRGSLTAPNGIERAVESNSWVGPSGGILIVLDADDDCPAELAPALLNRARSTLPDRYVSVVLANREYEAWFLASASSIAGRFGFRADMEMPDSPEGVRDAKGWLSEHRPRGHPYKETVDQAVLTSAFDISLARKGSPSFDKFCRELQELLSPRAS